MIDRRDGTRDKVIYGGIASVDEHGATRDCVIRNISDKGASLEFGDATALPTEMNLTVARKARSFLSRIIWRRGNTVGVAFRDIDSDLSERLRKSEKKKRELQRRIKILLGEG